jgi:hypothetical protein
MKSAPFFLRCLGLFFATIAFALNSTPARAQDALSAAERFTATADGKFNYDLGVLTVQGQFVSTDINVTTTLKPDASTLNAISGKPVIKRSVFAAATSAVAPKFSVSKETYTISNIPYAIVSAGPQTAAGYMVPTTVRLINLATRAAIPAGGNLNPGFVISGRERKTVLVRAVGPGLAAFGVTNPLADPLLTVYSGSTIVGTNDNWSGDPTQAAALQIAFTNSGAFTIPSGSKDAALLLTLDPGNYTAVARGADGGGGELIVEVYEVP